jgi:hypothetical protein
LVEGFDDMHWQAANLVRKIEAREWQRSLSSAFWQRN